MTALRLLALARDAGAARHIVEIVKVAQAVASIDVRFVAADAAVRALGQCGEPFEPFAVATPYGFDISETDAAHVRRALAQVFDAFAPDAVLVGLASFRGGIDDAGLFLARRQGIPSLLLLDDVGHHHDTASLRPDCTLAVSDSIAEWARETLQVPVVMIGPPRHHALSTAPVECMRAQGRTIFGVADGIQLITFFAQTDLLPGHDTNFDALLDTLRQRHASGAAFEFLVRAHPGFPETGTQCHARAKAAGIKAQLDVDSDPALVLASSDVVLSCVSSSIADYVWLARASDGLNAHLAYLLIGDPIRTHLEQEFGNWQPELARTGVAKVITSTAGLEDFLRASLAGRLAPFAYQRGMVPGETPMARALAVVRDLVAGQPPAVAAGAR